MKSSSIKSLLVLPALSGLLVILSPSVKAQFRGHADASELAPQFCSIRQPAKPKTPADSTHGSSLPSPSTAWKLSLWSSVLPIVAGFAVGGEEHPELASGLVVTGMIIGPSTGYFYGHCGGRGATGILIRTATGGAAVGLAAIIVASSDEKGWDELGQIVLAGGIIGIGMTAVAVEGIHDIYHVKYEVSDRNRKLKGSSFSIAPAYFPKDKAMGLSLSIRLR